MRNRNWDREKAAALYAEGKSDAEIAEAVGVMPSTIASWRRKQKLSTHAAAAAPTADESPVLNENAAAPPRTPPTILPMPEPDVPSIRIELECGYVNAQAESHEALLSLAEGLVTICRGLFVMQKEANHE